MLRFKPNVTLSSPFIYVYFLFTPQLSLISCVLFAGIGILRGRTCYWFRS